MQMLDGHARGPGRLAAGPVVVVAIALVMLIGDLGGTSSTDALPQAPAERTSASSTATGREKVRTRPSGPRAATVVPVTTPSTVRVRAAGVPSSPSPDADGSDATTHVPSPHPVAADTGRPSDDAS